MFKSFLSTVKERKLALFSIVFFGVLTIWWISISVRGLKEGNENNIFTVTYWWVSIWGGIAGLFIARKWGGSKSVLGRAFYAFSIGLLGQAFGQIVYSYYIYVRGVEVPYPSLGDIGYFSTGMFYVYGLIQLGKATGANMSFKTYRGRIIALVIPIFFLALSYFLFLRGSGNVVDFHRPIKTIIDFGFPLVDAIFLSFAIVAYLNSRKFLGGIMRSPILFLLLALVVEAIADFTFVYQVSREQWYVGGTNDFMYLISYTLMALALMQLGYVFSKLTENNHD